MYFVLRFPEGAVDFDATKADKNGTREGYIHIFLNVKQVEYAIGTSYISPELAELVIDREIAGRSFDEVLAEKTAFSERIFIDFLIKFQKRGCKMKIFVIYYVMVVKNESIGVGFWRTRS